MIRAEGGLGVTPGTIVLYSPVVRNRRITSDRDVSRGINVTALDVDVPDFVHAESHVIHCVIDHADIGIGAVDAEPGATVVSHGVSIRATRLGGFAVHRALFETGHDEGHTYRVATVDHKALLQREAGVTSQGNLH